MRNRATQTRFEDLPYDVAKQIMIPLAKSTNGAKDIAKVICVNKSFNEFGRDRDILKCLKFGSDCDPYLQASFWNDKGLYAKAECEAFINIPNSSETRVEVIRKCAQIAVEYWCWVGRRTLVLSEQAEAMGRPHTRSMTRREKEYKEYMRPGWEDLFATVQELKSVIYEAFQPKGGQ